MKLEEEPHAGMYATGEVHRAITSSSRKNEAAGQNGNNYLFWMCLVVKMKSDAVKNIT